MSVLSSSGLGMNGRSDRRRRMSDCGGAWLLLYLLESMRRGHVATRGCRDGGNGGGSGVG